MYISGLRAKNLGISIFSKLLFATGWWCVKICKSQPGFIMALFEVQDLTKPQGAKFSEMPCCNCVLVESS